MAAAFISCCCSDTISAGSSASDFTRSRERVMTPQLEDYSYTSFTNSQSEWATSVSDQSATTKHSNSQLGTRHSQNFCEVAEQLDRRGQEHISTGKPSPRDMVSFDSTTASEATEMDYSEEFDTETKRSSTKTQERPYSYQSSFYSLERSQTDQSDYSSDFIGHTPAVSYNILSLRKDKVPCFILVYHHINHYVHV